MGTIAEKLNYTKTWINKARDNWSNIIYGAAPVDTLSNFANNITEKNLNLVGIWNCQVANADPANVEKGKTYFTGSGLHTGTLEPKAGNLVNSVSFIGKYASSTYYNSSNSGCCINPDTGDCIIYIQGGTSSGFESIRFDRVSIPAGAVWGPQSYYSSTSMPTGNLYSILISNITYPIDVVCNFSTTNASVDYVYADVTITKA